MIQDSYENTSAARKKHLLQSDILIATLLLLLILVLISPNFSYKKVTDIFSTLLSIIILISLVFRRIKPALMLSISTVCATALIIINPVPPVISIVVPIVVYSASRYMPTHRLVTLIIGLIFSIIGPLRWQLDYLANGHIRDFVLQQIVSQMTICASSVVIPYLIGQRFLTINQNRLREIQSTKERYQLLQERRDQELHMAEVRIRNSIAQELHDIVAHSLSIMIVQAEGAKSITQKNPEKIDDILGTIADTGRESLTEMRRIVSVLRSGESSSVEYSPTPDLADIPEMLARAGERVTFDAPELPKVNATLGLTAYRLIQESVTNFLKHAGPNAIATVKIRIKPNVLYLEIIDNGLGAAASGDGRGSGLTGMYERVSSIDGYVVAKPEPGGGFGVRAYLPFNNNMKE